MVLVFCLLIFSEQSMCLFVRFFSSNTWPSTFLPWLIKVSCLVKGAGDIIKAMKLIIGGLLLEKGCNQSQTNAFKSYRARNEQHDSARPNL